jgi:hypothetical protein
MGIKLGIKLNSHKLVLGQLRSINKTKVPSGLVKKKVMVLDSQSKNGMGNPMDRDIQKSTVKSTLPEKAKFNPVIDLDTMITCIETSRL